MHWVEGGEVMKTLLMVVLLLATAHALVINGTAMATVSVPSNATITNGNITLRGAMPPAYNYSIVIVNSTLVVPTNSSVEHASVDVAAEEFETKGFLSGGSTIFNGAVFAPMKKTGNLSPHSTDGLYAESIITSGPYFEVCSRFPSNGSQFYWYGHACMPGGASVDYTRLYARNSSGRTEIASLVPCTTGSLGGEANVSQTSWEVCVKNLAYHVGTAQVLTDWGYAVAVETDASVSVGGIGAEDFGSALAGALAACESFPCTIPVDVANATLENVTITMTAVGGYPVNTTITIGNTTIALYGVLNETRLDFVAELQNASDSCAKEFCEVNITVASPEYSALEIEGEITYELLPPPAPAVELPPEPEPVVVPAPPPRRTYSSGGGSYAPPPIVEPVIVNETSDVLVEEAETIVEEAETIVEEAGAPKVIVEPVANITEPEVLEPEVLSPVREKAGMTGMLSFGWSALGALVVLLAIAAVWWLSQKREGGRKDDTRRLQRKD